MERQRREERMEAIFESVREYPGERPGFIARLLGLERSEVARMLPALEEHGFLLSEDERGGLWPFKKGG
jgi:DNA-binding IclR family transcriptional regulator